MTVQRDIFELMRSRLPDLTRNQKKLVEFALEDRQNFAVATVSELAGQTGVSPATIVRFAKELGFAGYNGLQRELRRSLRAELRGPERFRVARKPDADNESAVSPAIRQEMENIAALQDQFDAVALAAAVRMVSDASRLVVIGSRSTASLANHLWFAFGKAGLTAERVLSADFQAYDQIDRLDDTGCAVVIGFPRYLAELGRVIDFATRAGKRLLVITDSPFSPFRGDVTLYAPVESSSFVAFHSAPLILIATLMTEIAADKPERTLLALQRFEELAERQGLFRTSQTRE